MSTAAVNRTEKAVRLSMWSGPRNVSTALMYSFRQRSDTIVVDEPLYGHYLRVSSARHPAAREVMAQMECDGDLVARGMVSAPTVRPLLFFKNMAHHLVGVDWSLLDSLTNVLLIRDPREMLPSLARVLARPVLPDTGLARQCEILEYEEAAGREPIVIDARELLLDPPAVLAALCARLGVPFEAAMLSWPAGPKPEDGCWAPNWYANVHRSTHFAPYRPATASFPDDLLDLLAACEPYYRRLKRYELSPLVASTSASVTAGEQPHQE